MFHFDNLLVSVFLVEVFDHGVDVLYFPDQFAILLLGLLESDLCMAHLGVELLVDLLRVAGLERLHLLLHLVHLLSVLLLHLFHVGVVPVLPLCNLVLDASDLLL